LACIFRIKVFSEEKGWLSQNTDVFMSPICGLFQQCQKTSDSEVCHGGPSRPHFSFQRGGVLCFYMDLTDGLAWYGNWREGPPQNRRFDGLACLDWDAVTFLPYVSYVNCRKMAGYSMERGEAIGREWNSKIFGGVPQLTRATGQRNLIFYKCPSYYGWTETVSASYEGPSST
jgi:hypothetical protein